jgi:hypothetical protein
MVIPSEAHIIEHANHVAPSADNVVRAIRAYACVNKSGKWIEATKHVEFSSTGPATNRLRKPRKSHAQPDSHTIDLQAETDSRDSRQTSVTP